MPSGSSCSETARLATIEGELKHLAEADDRHAKAVEQVTASIKVAQTERREDHKELVGKLDEFILDHEQRVTSVEESTKSAHHRVDTIRSILQWAGGLVVTGILGALGWLVAK
jgi:hypothetical protein